MMFDMERMREYGRKCDLFNVQGYPPGGSTDEEIKDYEDAIMRGWLDFIAEEVRTVNEIWSDQVIQDDVANWLRPR